MQRGGYWITADIYPKHSAETTTSLPKSKSEAAFLERHNVEEINLTVMKPLKPFLKNKALQ